MGRPQALGYALTLLAAVLWASMGLFYRSLIQEYGLRPLTVVFVRATVAALALWLALGLGRPKQLMLKRRDLPFFIAFGFLGVALFYAVYVYAVDLAGVGVAAVLMYMAPAWVALLSIPLFGERLTAPKTVALLLALLGAALVGRVYDLVGLRIRGLGIAAGLGASLGYALYVLFCKAAARRGYRPWTALAFALALGALFLAPLQSPGELVDLLTTPPALARALILGLVLTLGAGVAFNAALAALPASVVSIVATVEPVIAMLLGYLLLGEQVGWPQALGAGLIITAVALLQGHSEGQAPRVARGNEL
jgi:DME family drug/metabolite transporter